MRPPLPPVHPVRGAAVLVRAVSPTGWLLPHQTHARVLAVGKRRCWARLDVCGVSVRFAWAHEFTVTNVGHWAELRGGGYVLAVALRDGDGINGDAGRAPATVDRADVRLGARIADLVRAWPALLGETPDVVIERSLHPYHDARYCARVRGLSSGMEFYRADGRTPGAAVRALWRKLSGAAGARRDGE